METLEGNPYSRWVQLIRQQSGKPQDRFLLGTVTAPPPGMRVQPDHIRWELDAEDLYIAADWLEHERTVRMEGMGADMHMEIRSPWKTGDRVLLLSMNGDQQFMVICKVVKAR
ncbi:DUF2577 domain-containing protein [Xylanibacillus composti]|uniref:DUF2577 domain-containing protein n=1 Tax=Xylanibacillus composti TaxID=1572762 RepID=A0A8J4H4P1_9BACL|nr:DUF2577 family protein [Xylanibacillus composti]MDT9725088.1 DUF2577 domain-containing protein [Xylanibacillus composti]GIQ70903.1 hypothetical protein XYCOK13_37270 [Xylanibacillus composti]